MVAKPPRAGWRFPGFITKSLLLNITSPLLCNEEEDIPPPFSTPMLSDTPCNEALMQCVEDSLACSGAQTEL